MKISSFDPRRQLQYFACRLAVKLGGLILPGRKMDKTPTMNFAISLARELRLTPIRFLRSRGFVIYFEEQRVAVVASAPAGAP